MCQHVGCACGCRYKPYVVAQVASKPEAEAEALLQEYLAGANEGRRQFELTTPLLHSSDGAVSFMITGIQVSLKHPSDPLCLSGFAVHWRLAPGCWRAHGRGPAMPRQCLSHLSADPINVAGGESALFAKPALG